MTKKAAKSRRRRILAGTAALLLGLHAMAGTDSGEPPSGEPPSGTACRDERSPLILAHRGASGARPENSLEAFRLAVEWGADYIELDVVMSGDGVLMCLHDTDLVGTTDVRTKFPNRWARNAKGAPVDAEGNPVGFGRRVWLPKDFTREELQSLLLRERYDTAETPRKVSHGFDGRVGTIPTFEECLRFIREEERERGRTVGLYVELKAPRLHKDWGLPLEDELLRALGRYGYTDRDSPVIIQSFEDTSLMGLAGKTDIRLGQLISNSKIKPYGNTHAFGEMITDRGLARIATYAYAIGPNQDLVVNNQTGKATDLASRAHAAGLKVHSYTVRNDALPAYIRRLGYENDGFPGEGVGGYRHMEDLLAAGVDGIFTDFANTLHRLCADRGYR